MSQSAWRSAQIYLRASGSGLMRSTQIDLEIPGTATVYGSRELTRERHGGPYATTSLRSLSDPQFHSVDIMRVSLRCTACGEVTGPPFPPNLQVATIEGKLAAGASRLKCGHLQVDQNRH